MLKNLILIIFIVLIILFAGIFTVDVRENAVVTNNYNKEQIVYARGVHFAIPGVTKITYVYINERTAVLNIPLAVIGESAVATQMLVSWHVSNPQTYANVINKSAKEHLIKNLAHTITSKLNVDTANLSLSQLNQTTSLLNQALLIENLGITIDNIQLVNLPVESTGNQTGNVLVVESAEALVPGNSSAHMSSESMPNLEQLVIESAYYQAQNIKTQTEIQEANLYNPLRLKNAKFYDYFRKVDIYRQSAESKGDIPPLEQLYKQ